MSISKKLVAGALAVVAAAGSADAAVTGVSLWNFSQDFNFEAFGGSLPDVPGIPLSFMNCNIGRPGSTMIGSGGKVTATLGSNTMSINTIQWAVLSSEVNGFANLVGTTAISFNFSELTADSMKADLIIGDLAGNSAGILGVVLTNGIQDFSVSTLAPRSNSGPLDWSRITDISIKFHKVADNSIVRSVSFDSFFAVGAVPAPGAMVVLGAAGLVGLRRRR